MKEEDGVEITHQESIELAEILRELIKTNTGAEILETLDLSDEYIEELIKKLDV